jgi:hypothetical protein
MRYLLGEAGGAAAVFGNSSGAVLALHAAAAGLPLTRLAAPTLVLDGSDTGAWAANAARALTAALPDAQHRTLDGQAHNVAWDVLAPALREFLTG